jgi:hypothetical protein
MSEKIAPATKAVPRKDGFKSGSANPNLSTPIDNEGKVWKTHEPGNSIFNKPTTH